MKNTPKLIDLYHKWMKTGRIPMGGLCSTLGWLDLLDHLKTLDLFVPTVNDTHILKQEGTCTAFWGSDEPVYKWTGSNRAFSKWIKYTDKRNHKFTERRQNIVLFICAIHGEL